MEEFEVVFTDINIKETRAKLESVGAKKIFKRTYHRLNFEYPDWRLDKNNSWIRLRDEGEKVTLAFKKRIGAGAGEHDNDLDMEEIEFEVSNYEKVRDFFLAIGFVHKLEVENRRERWQYQNIQFDLDTYPLIPTVIEIESDSWDGVSKGIQLLGFDPAKQRICSMSQIAKDYGVDYADYIIYRFDKQVKREQPRHSEI